MRSFQKFGIWEDHCKSLKDSVDYQKGFAHGKTGSYDNILQDQSEDYYAGIAEGMRLHYFMHRECYPDPSAD